MSKPQPKIQAASLARGGEAVPWTAYLHLLVIYLVWGGAYLLVKLVVSGAAVITPLQLLTARTWCATLLLGIISLARTGLPGRVSLRDVGLCAASGVLMWATGNGFATQAAKHASSSFIVMALGTIPLWSTMLDCIIERSVPDRRTALALAVGFVGLGLVVGPALFSHGAIVEQGYEGLTILLLITAGVTWSLGTILQRPLAGRLDPGWAATMQVGTAAAVVSLFAIHENAPILPQPPSEIQVVAFVLLVVFASVVSLLSYIKVVRVFSPVVASTFAYINPVVGMVLGVLVLGETITPLSIVGLVVVLASVAVVVATPRRGR